MTISASDANKLLCDNNTVKTHHVNRSDFLRKHVHQCSPMFKLLFDVHQCSPVFFLLNIVYFSVCLTSNKFNGLRTNLPMSLPDFIHRRVGVGELDRR